VSLLVDAMVESAGSDVHAESRAPPPRSYAEEPPRLVISNTCEATAVVPTKFPRFWIVRISE
jgi:hypothetical protein